MRQKVLNAQGQLHKRRGKTEPVLLDAAELEYLVNLMGSHLRWREWLVPGE